MNLFISNFEKMKKFIFDIILTTFTFCVIWVSVEYLVTKVHVQNEYSYKYNYVQNNPTIKTLLIGHSHFNHGINPYLLGDSVFNFATSGRWIYWDAQLLPRILPKMPNLKTVLFPLGYHMPYGSWHYRRFKDLRPLDKDYAYNYAKYMDTYYDRFPENLYMSSALIHNRLGIQYWQDKPVDSLGYGKVVGQDGQFEKRSVSPDMFEKPFAKECYEEYKNYLMGLAKLCYENDIRFIAVTCPCANCYINDTRPQGMQNLYALIDSVRAYYPIEYKCYLDDPEFREDSIYYNCSHLNSSGADILAKRVKADFGL